MTPNSRCELISWEQVYQLSRTLALTLHAAAFEPELIVAISRGGCVPARILCDYLDVFDLDVIKIEHYHGTAKQPSVILRYPLSAAVDGRRVLLIDDVSDTGDSFDIAIKHLLEKGHPAELKTAVLHHKTDSSYTPDYYIELIREWHWVIYPWAVVEDLRSILDGMEQAPSSSVEFDQYLKQHHQLEVPQQILEDVIALRH